MGREDYMTQNFAVIGAAGYIAPRHFKAIKETGNRIVAVLDPHDSVGILDQYDYNIDYFSEDARFTRYLQKLRHSDSPDSVDWISVCSPNYMHDAHCWLALEAGANVICEKPLVINPWNLDILEDVEVRTGQRIFTVLQLRLHPELLKLKDTLLQETDYQHHVQLRYITPRGRWYHESWKGDEEKSGGLVTNIGIHLFDMLLWLFGEVGLMEIHYHGDKRVDGAIYQKQAMVEFHLSIDEKDWTQEEQIAHKPVRVLTIGDQRINFSDGFADLHTEIYKRTLAGNGFGLDEARPAIELTQKLREIIKKEEE